VYLIDGRPHECVLIDIGCGLKTEKIIKNISEAGFDLGLISAVVNTHCHYRHAGGNQKLNKLLGYCEVIAHELDADAIEKGDQRLTKANIYGQIFEPCDVHFRICTTDIKTMETIGLGGHCTIGVGDIDFVPIHVPGHTPGSIVLYGEIDGAHVMFTGDLDEPPTNRRDLEIWRESIQRLINLKIDIIYGGHSIIFEEPKKWLGRLTKF